MIGNNYPLFISKARQAAASGNHSLNTHNNFGIDALFFSATALEAFINDYPVLIKPFLVYEAEKGKQPECIKLAFNLLCELEEQRASTKTKFELLHYILTGKAFDHDLQIYKDLIFLFELRNEIAHPKVRNISLKKDEFEIDETAQLQSVKARLQSRNLLSGHENFYGPLYVMLEAKTVADWSVRLAIDVVNYFVETTPECRFKKELLVSYIIPDKAKYIATGKK